VLILAIIVLGMMVGAVAQWILGRRGTRPDWAMALVAGIVGSFVGGLLFSLIAGDGLALKPSGLIGTLVGALIVTFVWMQVRKRQAQVARAEASSQRRR
jgi:uncharacterized membrane protein YeaQ/YmgE (transglycosylase-associated protein family)